MLDVVQLGEAAAVVRGTEVLELLERLLAEVAAVNEEEHPARLGELDEAVGEVDGGVGLAGAGRHLDERSRLVGREGPLEVGDGLHLGLPEVGGDEGRHLAQALVELLVRARPVEQRLGTMERKDVAGARFGVQVVGEVRFGTGALERERERAAPRRQLGRQTHDVLCRLLRHAGKGEALWFRLERTDRLPAHEEGVVGLAGVEGEFPDRHALSGGQVSPSAVLDSPTAGV